LTPELTKYRLHIDWVLLKSNEGEWRQASEDSPLASTLLVKRYVTLVALNQSIAFEITITFGKIKSVMNEYEA
jgi:hypothetical protein